MGWPRPPAPISAPSVAVPTLMTAALLMPARISGLARGSSMRRSTAPGGRPERLGRLAQRRRDADEAGVGVAHDGQQTVEEQRDDARGAAPMPSSGIMNTSSASVGSVCMTPTAASTT